MSGSSRLRDLRGSVYDRRSRRTWLLDTWGDGESCPCVHCDGPLDAETLTVDRIVPGSQGGRYVRDNVQPSCLACNVWRGDNAYVPHPRWDGELRSAAQLAAEPEPVVVMATAV